jgi:hypothetical protein
MYGPGGFGKTKRSKGRETPDFNSTPPEIEWVKGEKKMAMGEPTCMHKTQKETEWSTEWGENIAKYFLQAVALFARGLILGLGFGAGVFTAYSIVIRYI